MPVTKIVSLLFSLQVALCYIPDPLIDPFPKLIGGFNSVSYPDITEINPVTKDIVIAGSTADAALTSVGGCGGFPCGMITLYEGARFFHRWTKIIPENPSIYLISFTPNG